MIKKNDKITTKFKDIVLIKKVYKFIKENYSSFTVISINMEDNTLDIYFEREVYDYYKDIIELQNNLKKYLKDNYEQETLRINVVKY